MLHLGKARRRGARAALIAAVTALTVGLVGTGVGAGANAAPASVGDRATTISNDLVKIEPAKVKGTFTNPDTGKQGRVVGKFMPTEFTGENGSLQVEGLLTGVFTGAKLPEGTPRHFSESVVFDVVGSGSSATMQNAGFQTAAFVPAAAGDCDVLNLDLGPLDLNLLGLQIDLAPVVLDIVAQPGAGNLLGNLLCAVAGLLDGGLGGGLGGLLDGVVDALNGLLGGLLDLQAINDLIGQITDVLGGLTGATQTLSA